MFELAWPWVFALLPLPWLARLVLPAADSGEPVLKVGFLDELEGLAGRRARLNLPTWRQQAPFVVIWLLLLCAFAVATMRSFVAFGTRMRVRSSSVAGVASTRRVNAANSWCAEATAARQSFGSSGMVGAAASRSESISATSTRFCASVRPSGSMPGR